MLATYLKGRKERRMLHSETAEKIDTVQETVNGKSDALHKRVDELTASLTAAGVKVPPST